MFEEVKKVIDNASKILIFTHLNPDGDALGSSVAFKKAMESLGKKSDIILEKPLSPYFDCFGDNFILREDKGNDYDLMVSLDCGDMERMGEIKDLFTGNTLSIDHHDSNKYFADVNYVEAGSPATGLIIYKLIRYLGIEITKEIADAIYGAILTDTGGFMFSNTGSETHEVAAELIKAGADYYTLNKKLMQEKEYHRHLLTAYAIKNMEFYRNGEICVCTITNEEATELNMTPADTTGLTSVPRNVKGVEVGILLTEIVKGTVKASFRSDMKADVAKLAEKFGGGGHVRASGATFKDQDINTVKEKLIKEAMVSF